MSTGEPLITVVLGASRLATEALAASLTAHGLTVTTADVAPSIAVLIAPDDAAWSQLRALDVPGVLVADVAPDDGELVDAVTCGLHGVVPSTCGADELAGVLHHVAGGDSALTTVQLRTAVDGLRRARTTSGPVELSPREREILESIDRGESVKQTAHRLGISPRTVDNTQRILFRKLTARNRAQAVARAHALGLIASEAS